MILLSLLACRADSDAVAAHEPVHFVLHGGHIAGGDIADVEIDRGRVVAIGAVDASAAVIDVTDEWLAPAVIDSHVHLAYLGGPDTMADGGVAGVVDLAAPIAYLATDPEPLRRIASGPMITAVHGYPTQSWGADGYGLECADRAAAVAAVGTVASSTTTPSPRSWPLRTRGG